MNHIRLIILLTLFSLTGCFFWSGVIDSQDKSDFKTNTFSYYEYVGYTEKDYEEFVEYIFQEYLSDIAKRIKDEHILLPPIKLLEFTHLALVDKYKDVNFQNTNRGISSKRNARETTKLVADLLKRIHLFQSIAIGASDNNTNDIFIDPSIGVYKKYSQIPDPVGPILAYPSFGIISPALSKEIVSIEFIFLSGELVINQSVGFGGGYTFVSTQWLEDNPSIDTNMKRNAFCVALRNLIINILEQRDNLDNQI